MNSDHIRQILAEGERLTIEYKQCVRELNNSVWETVCSFSNRYGGHLILGAEDDGTPVGVNPNAAPQMKKNFTNMLNNPQKTSPSLFLNLEEVMLDEMLLLYAHIPISSQIQSCSGRIYDRNEDGDFDITNSAELVAQLALRKSSAYTEREIFPYVTENELRLDLVERAQKMAIALNADHPWKGMTPSEMLRSTGLYEDDWRTGKKGFNLAAILLFGRDDVIRSCAPGYMTDALLRRENIDRYDDRLMVGTNLIEAYDQLIGFISRHTLDRFFLVDNQRVSVRSWIARELVSNILVHREYSKGFLAKIVVENERLYAENWNRSNRHGRINPEDFTPDAKNPLLAWFFVNIGRADWMGSGIRNLYKYAKIYSGGEPELIEGDVFKTVIPLKLGPNATEDLRSDLRTGSAQVGAQDERLSMLLDYCAIPRSRDEMQQHYKISSREYFRNNVLKPLLESGQLKMTIPDKPNSKHQKYVRN
ncbi:MAG: putative DNA binding domain-containing protein [Peptococcaceae bacterium]|nr:putative DNA binding domain-containing protein [Peptococcaceae bacterium]